MLKLIVVCALVVVCPVSPNSARPSVSPNSERPSVSPNSARPGNVLFMIRSDYD